MKAAQLIKFEGSGGIEIVGVDKPKISQGKILAQIHAAGVNPIDWKIAHGMMPLTLPLTMGGDFAGVIIEVGSDVLNFKPGDKVYGQAPAFAGGTGTFAQFALAKKDTVAFKPSSLNFMEAGALPLVGVSALQGLTEHLNLQNGQKILIHGGAGGIGSIAIQIAKYIGAYVATTVSPNDMEYVKKLGADKVINYKSQRFEDLLSNQDSVFDTVGKDTYKRSFKVLKQGGSMVSMLEEPDEQLMKQYGVTVTSQQTRVTTERLNRLTELVEQKVVTVYIEKAFTLDQTAQALSYLENTPPQGKVVVVVKE